MMTGGGVLYGLAANICGTEMTAALILTEITTPLLHARYFFKPYRDLTPTTAALYGILNKLFAVIFLVARCVAGPILTYKTITNTATPGLIKVGAMGVQAVSYFWAIRILKIALGHSKRGLKRNSAA